MASLLLLLLSLSLVSFTLPTGDTHIAKRKSFEIIIGGGGNPPPSPSPEPEPEPEDCSPPPPPPPCPPAPQLPPPQRQRAPPKPPPKSRGQPPLPLVGFESTLLEKVFPVLKAFKKLVTRDPMLILKTWEGTDICNKYKYLGLECAIFPNTTDKALASIQFNGFNFGGDKLVLHNFLDKLDTVTIFHANSNDFLGSVPEVTNLKYLFELDLSNNKLTGDFPASVLKAKNLTFLDLRFNTFSGCVPPQVFNLDLDVLFINNNNLVQTLPSNLGSITALYLTFANNRLAFRFKFLSFFYFGK